MTRSDVSRQHRKFAVNLINGHPNEPLSVRGTSVNRQLDLYLYGQDRSYSTLSPVV